MIFAIICSFSTPVLAQALAISGSSACWRSICLVNFNRKQPQNLHGSCLFFAAFSSTATNVTVKQNRIQLQYTQDGFIHIAASGWISVNTEEKKNKHHIQKVKNR